MSTERNKQGEAYPKRFHIPPDIARLGGGYNAFIVKQMRAAHAKRMADAQAPKRSKQSHRNSAKRRKTN